MPKKAAATALAECLEFGIETIVVPGSGFAERSSDGERLQNELLDLLQRRSARVLGPNCFGVYSSAGGVNMTPFSQIPIGRVALLSQSGNVAEQAFMGARRRGFGFSHAVGLGNQLDLAFADFLDWLEDDPETSAIGMYVEGLPPAGGAAFIEALHRCVVTGKTVVALKGGVRDRCGGHRVAHGFAQCRLTRLGGRPPHSWRHRRQQR